MKRVCAVIFDLDNVLYDEREYLYAAYRNIARYLSENFDLDEEDIYQRLVDDFRKKTSMYPRLFNDLLRDLGLEQELLPELLKIFAETQPDLTLNTTTEEILRQLRTQAVKLGLLTNGMVKVQKNKVRLLGIEKYFEVVLYARELGRELEKPNPKAYLALLEALEVEAEHTICVGDNPHTDFWGAKKLGIHTVRLLKGEFKDIILTADYEADATVRTLQEFYEYLKGTWMWPIR